MLEPRFFPRADIDLPMFLAGANARVAGRIVNVSEGGVLVIAKTSYQAGDTVRVIVELPTRVEPIVVEGSVVRCQPEEGLLGRYRIAIDFVSLDEQDASAIRGLVGADQNISWDGCTGRIPRDAAVRFIPMIRRMARTVAQRLPPQVSVDDLVGAGFVALVELYAKNPGVSLADLERTAMPRIRWAMLDELRNADPLSRRMRQRARRIGKAARELEQSLGRKPSHAEVAEHMNISHESYGAALKLAQSGEPSSIDSYDDFELADQREPGPEEAMNQTESLGKLRFALDALPPRLRKVLELYYGDDLTLRQIGNILGVTEARISQLLSDAVRRLRVGCASQPPPGLKSNRPGKISSLPPKGRKSRPVATPNAA